MELPRYRSSALPEEATISPQMAAAGAGASGQAAAAALREVANVTREIAAISSEMAANRRLAEMQAEIDNEMMIWERQKNLPEVTPSEWGGMATDVPTPTGALISQQMKSLENKFKSEKIKGLSWGMRQQFDAKRDEMLQKMQVEMRKRAREADIERARVDGLRTVALLQNAGQYEEAVDQLGRLHQVGLIDYELADKLAYSALAARDENRIYGALLSGEMGLTELLFEAQDLPYHSEEDRHRIVKRLLDVEAQRERQQERQDDRDAARRAVSLWLDIENLNAADVARMSGLRPSDQVSIINKIRELKYAPDRDEIDGLRQANLIISTFMMKPEIGREAVFRDLSMVAGLSTDTFLKYLRTTDDIADSRFASTEFTMAMNMGTSRIFNGTADPVAFRMGHTVPKIADDIQAVNSDFLWDGYQAMLKEGPQFNASAWVTENIGKYTSRVEDILAAETNPLDGPIIRDSSGRIDVDESMKNIARTIPEAERMPYVRRLQEKALIEGNKR